MIVRLTLAALFVVPAAMAYPWQTTTDRWLLGAAVAAFALAVGVGAHALDELKGRPLRTKIPDRVLVVLAGVSIVGACAIGLAGAVTFEAWLALRGLRTPSWG